MKVRQSAHFKLVTIPKESDIEAGDYVAINKVTPPKVVKCEVSEEVKEKITEQLEELGKESPASSGALSKTGDK